MRAWLAFMFLLAAPCLASGKEEAGAIAAVDEWLEIPIPDQTQREERLVWEYAANYSPLSWYVFRRGHTLAASPEASRPRSPRPPFLPAEGKRADGIVAQRIDDGWLVAFNHGEFGAELSWFSEDGKENRKISIHHVVEFVRWQGKWHAIEGLAHLGSSRGSLIELDRSQGAWQTRTVTQLPAAPSAVSAKANGNLLITLSDSLVELEPDGRLRILLADAPWMGLYATSSIWDEETGTLYIGMRQYVARYEIATSTLAMLIPSRAFLHRLAPDQERGVRRQATLMGTHLWSD